MSKYDVEYKKLAVLLLPICLRQRTLIALLSVLVTPVQWLSERFAEYRAMKDMRLKHNGQVCYLRGILNDQFDPVARRIRVTDNESQHAAVIILRRLLHPVLRIDGRGKAGYKALRIYRRGWEATGAVGFVVEIPQELRGTINEQELQAVVNTYKLAGTRYFINYYS
ncbi:MAG: hypothetical protein IJ782_01985 [Prevotella sp.]|nr:hypothetical protein [Prevotella sp.]